MKIVKLIVASSAIALVMACNHADKNAASMDDSSSFKNTLSKGADSLKNRVDKDKSELKATLDSLIAEANIRIDTLDNKMYQASAKQRKKLYAIKVKIMQGRDELKGDLKEVDRKADADWKKFKQTVSAEADSLKKAL